MNLIPSNQALNTHGTFTDQQLQKKSNNSFFFLLLLFIFTSQFFFGPLAPVFNYFINNLKNYRSSVSDQKQISINWKYDCRSTGQICKNILSNHWIKWNSIAPHKILVFCRLDIGLMQQFRFWDSGDVLSNRYSL